MSTSRLPTTAELRGRLARTDALVSMPGLLVIGVHMATVLDLSGPEWMRFLGAAAIYAVVAIFASEAIRGRQQAPLRDYLDTEGSDRKGSEDSLHAAFRTAVSLPPSMMRVTIGSWLIAGLVIPLISGLLGEVSWLHPTRLVSLVVGVVCSGAFSAGFVFFGAKRCLDDVRDELAARIPDPDVRRSLIAPVPLARKLQFGVAGSSIALLIFAMGLAYSRAANGLEDLAVRWQADVLASIAERMHVSEVDADDEYDYADDEGEEVDTYAEESAAPGFEDVVISVVPDTALLPHPIDFAVIEPGEDRDVADWVSHAEIAAAVEAGARTGSLKRSSIDWIQSWHVLPSGEVLVAATPRGSLHGSLGDIETAMAVVLALALVLCLATAHLLSADVRRSTQAIRDGAERLALGDLQAISSHESEDELGDLSRSFAHMGLALRRMVTGVADAADRVDATASEMASISQSVAVASADQVRRIQQATELMSEIKSQVTGVADSAQALNISVEESSSSILELGAAGDELNETASVLGEKVDDVSTSIEEMVRSVNQVNSNSDALADIAAETSSSMEEMASAMRAVDNTAGKTADLGRTVVASAENGQEKVRQTIQGMEAIRDATDSAESVIRGLGQRTTEIGAILDVIDDVADETNLLALNAAIIAAQAGEHGRAFSVVAEEIKELADRVLASTKEIGGLIRSVQEESTNATGAIEAGSRSVASGVDLSADAGVSLEQITSSSRESGTRIGEILAAVREQTKAAAHVVDLMEQVSGGVDQISASCAEQNRGNEVVHRSAVTMREVAQQVRRTTEEQSRGFGRIRESVEGVRQAVETINASLQDQSQACNQVAEFLDQVYERTRTNEDSGQRMDEAMRGLLSQAESLRQDVEKFRI